MPDTTALDTIGKIADALQEQHNTRVETYWRARQELLSAASDNGDVLAELHERYQAAYAAMGASYEALRIARHYQIPGAV